MLFTEEHRRVKLYNLGIINEKPILFDILDKISGLNECPYSMLNHSEFKYLNFKYLNSEFQPMLTYFTNSNEVKFSKKFWGCFKITSYFYRHDVELELVKHLNKEYNIPLNCRIMIPKI